MTNSKNKLKTNAPQDLNLFDCWPDGYSRYYAISSILQIIFGKKQIGILDVGGDSMWMNLFLQETALNYKLTVVDLREPDFKVEGIDYITGDFFDFTPKHEQCDAIINTDVLEHVPDNMKMKLVTRCIELANSVAIFSGPYDDDAVTRAERTIDRLSKKITGKQQRWLKEHFEFGKPNSKDIENAITASGKSYLCLSTNNLDNWLLSFAINLVNKDLMPIDGTAELNVFYNQHISEVGDFEGKPYRKVYIVFKDDRLYRDMKPKIDALFVANTAKKTEYTANALELLINQVCKNHTSLTARISELDTRLDLANREIILRDEGIQSLDAQLKKIRSSKPYMVAKFVRKSVDRLRRSAS